MKFHILTSTRRLLRGLLAVGIATLTLEASAADQMIADAVVVEVAVNGGADTSNPGFTCIRVTPGPVAACSAGYVAITNNNRQLIATALLAKSTGARVAFYYNDAVATQHCPALVFTTCSVNSIILK